MRVLVLGGTGHIGSAVSRVFAEAGHEVTATGRTPGQRANLTGTGVRISAGDDLIPGVIEHWIDRIVPDIVVDAATPYPIWLSDTRATEPTRQAVERIRRVLAGCERSEARLVLVSSFTTLPPPDAGVSDEILPAMHCYFDLKKRVEAQVLNAVDQGRVRGCVVNPAAFLGPYDLKPQALAFVPSLLAGKVWALTRAEVNVVDVRDVARCVSALSQADAPPRQVPIFGHSLSVAQLAARICKKAGASPPRLSANAAVGLAGLYWLENAMALAGKRTPWPSLPVMLVMASYAAPPSADQLTHGGQVRDLDDTLLDTIAWYRQIGRC